MLEPAPDAAVLQPLLTPCTGLLSHHPPVRPSPLRQVRRPPPRTGPHPLHYHLPALQIVRREHPRNPEPAHLLLRAGPQGIPSIHARPPLQLGLHQRAHAAHLCHSAAPGLSAQSCPYVLCAVQEAEGAGVVPEQ